MIRYSVLLTLSYKKKLTYYNIGIFFKNYALVLKRMNAYLTQL